MSASLISTFRNSNITNMKKLTSLAEGNLELQHLLIATVETFVFEQGQIEADGSSLLQASRAKRRKSGSSKEATGEDESAPAQIEVPHGIELRRGLRVFRGWGQRMSLDLILLCAAIERTTHQLDQGRIAQVLGVRLGHTLVRSHPGPCGHYRQEAAF